MCKNNNLHLYIMCINNNNNNDKIHILRGIVHRFKLFSGGPLKKKKLKKSVEIRWTSYGKSLKNSVKFLLKTKVSLIHLTVIEA